MIGYVMVGTNDVERARGFYDALLPLLGAKRMMDMERGSFWSTGPGQPMFSAVKPYDGGEACVGNGCMVSLSAKDHETVDSVHAKAMELGSPCEGKPGYRGPEDFGFYGAYFRDPDGNKICVFNWKPKAAA